MAYQTEVKKIDSQLTDGLLGVSNSLAYRVHEIERHFHGRERWLGVHASPDPGVNQCGDTMLPLTIASATAADTYGTEACIIGTGDTPRMNRLGTVTPNTKFDLHHMVISAISVDAKTHKFKITYGSGTYADANTAGQYTEIMLHSDAGTGMVAKGEIPIACPRIPAGNKVWIASKDNHSAAITINFYFGIHEYEG